MPYDARAMSVETGWFAICVSGTGFILLGILAALHLVLDALPDTLKQKDQAGVLCALGQIAPMGHVGHISFLKTQRGLDGLFPRRIFCLAGLLIHFWNKFCITDPLRGKRRLIGVEANMHPCEPSST